MLKLPEPVYILISFAFLFGPLNASFGLRENYLLMCNGPFLVTM